MLELAPKELAREIHHLGWRPSPLQLIDLAAQLADAMCHVHALGIVHRDINPSNILLGKRLQSGTLLDPDAACMPGSGASNAVKVYFEDYADILIEDYADGCRDSDDVHLSKLRVNI